MWMSNNPRRNSSQAGPAKSWCGYFIWKEGRGVIYRKLGHEQVGQEGRKGNKVYIYKQVDYYKQMERSLPGDL